MIITISGKAGSGKSTVAKTIAKKLNLKHYSMGDLQRKYAKEMGLTIEELGELESKDDKIDKEVDAYQTKLAKQEDDFIIDGWLSFHFIKKSIKIFLDCNENIGAERIFSDTKENKRDESERKVNDKEEAKKILIERMQTNRKRWLSYYNIDFLDMNNYDLVVDTSKIKAEQVVEKILRFIKEKR
jgi:cytidylate kinase